MPNPPMIANEHETERSASTSYRSAASPTGRTRVRLLLVLVGLAVGVLLSACSGDSAHVREVLIDYDHDEFAGSFLGNFPHEVRIHPGMTLRFKQAWTGEPHSVTGGRLVDEVMSQIVPVLQQYDGRPFSDIPQDDLVKVDELGRRLPPMHGDTIRTPVNQNVAQPCYRREGGPPEDTAQPCPDEQQQQPVFDGRFDFYNSGFIGYEGPGGNEFEIEFADDIDQGTYYFYCSVHGFLQYSKVVVVPEDQDIPSQAEVAREAREEIERWAQPLAASYERAVTADGGVTLVDPFVGQEMTVPKPLAGFAAADPWVHGFGSEFVPRDLTVRAGEKVTWSFIGPHTVSFQVPEYFSQMQIRDDGTVIYNPDALLAVNSPAPPDPLETLEQAEAGRPPVPATIDAGDWDGQEFVSSGVLWQGSWSITFTRPGTYRYACLIHPRMVGTVTVEG